MISVVVLVDIGNKAEKDEVNGPRRGGDLRVHVAGARDSHLDPPSPDQFLCCAIITIALIITFGMV